MISDLKEGEFFHEGETRFNLFNKTIDILIDKNVVLEYANDCVRYLNELSNEILDNLCRYSIDYCVNFCEYVGEVPPSTKAMRDILKYIEPITLHITNKNDNHTVAIDLELNCAWEEEHGMQWIIRGNRILYVGPYEGICAWNDEQFYKEFVPNFAYGNTFDDI